jgi:transposase InsO family protein
VQKTRRRQFGHFYARRKIGHKHPIDRSRGRRGNGCANAFAESCFSSFRTETGLKDVVPATHREDDLAPFDDLDAFCNSTRGHSSLGYLSPVGLKNKQPNTTSKPPEGVSPFSGQAPSFDPVQLAVRRTTTPKVMGGPR